MYMCVYLHNMYVYVFVCIYMYVYVSIGIYMHLCLCKFLLSEGQLSRCLGVKASSHLWRSFLRGLGFRV